MLKLGLEDTDVFLSRQTLDAFIYKTYTNISMKERNRILKHKYINSLIVD